jgi:hypothetical protein
VDLLLVSVDSTTARAHQDAAGMHLDPGALDALEKATEEKPRSKGAVAKRKPGGRQKTIPGGKSDDASGAVANSG